MKKQFRIVAGENIPYVQEAIQGLGHLTLLPGRSIKSVDLQDTNILLIRSITPVNEALLKDTPVEFVGSASAGTDHMDTAYLQSQNIEFASASGSNANSVADYVIAGLLFLANQQHFSLEGKTIGIVGVGNIGKLVQHKTKALGMRPILNDPFLAETGQIDHRSLEETLGCDVVTVHTPLTTDGPYPTHHLFNEHTLKWFKPTAIFINAARGEVVDTQALLAAITHQQIGHTIIDVWEHEPAINWNLFQAVTLGTPHIAGHSLDGKANGTFMIYAALCKHLGVEPSWNPTQVLPPPIVPLTEIPANPSSKQEAIREVVTQCYDIQADYHRMQALLASPPHERPPLFDALRTNYPIRREYHRTTVKLAKRMSQLRQVLAGLGFSTIGGEN